MGIVSASDIWRFIRGEKVKYDFLIKQQKEAIEAMETVIEECSKSCLECGQCGAYSDNPYNEGCIFSNYPHSFPLGGVAYGYSDITDAAKTLQAYCNGGDCRYCIFGRDDGDACILQGCPALWEKRLQLLKNKEEDE